MGDYLTSNGGIVNLKQVDVIMSEVGEIEDEVFKRRKSAEAKDQVSPPSPPKRRFARVDCLLMSIVGIIVEFVE